MSTALQHPLLTRCGVVHGFGGRGVAAPSGLRRPQQVHGAGVAEPDDAGELQPREADAVVSSIPDLAVGIVTADCVPVLASSAEGRVVAAIHAGWRGLVAGVVSAGLGTLRERAGGERLRAVIGPHIGACCYEVDDPVVGALRERFPRELPRALRSSRPGHVWLDLRVLVEAELGWMGLGPEDRASLPRSCTSCHPERFHSFRRQGDSAGRMVHHIASSRT